MEEECMRLYKKKKRKTLGEAGKLMGGVNAEWIARV